MVVVRLTVSSSPPPPPSQLGRILFFFLGCRNPRRAHPQPLSSRHRNHSPALPPTATTTARSSMSACGRARATRLAD